MGTRAQVMASLTRRVEQAAVEVVVNVHAAMVEGAPVDTGFLQANNQLSVGAPAEGTVPIGATVADIAGYKLEQGPLYVTNNAEYARAVNSRGVHAGWVEQAIDAGLAESGR